MILQTSSGIPLDTYYRLHPGLYGCFNIDIKAKKWAFTPYEIDETLYYFCKHLALPGIAAVLILLIIIFRIFKFVFIEYVNYLLIILTIIFFLSVGRELIRGWIYRIEEGLIFSPRLLLFKREAESYTHTINATTKTCYKLGFVGDIMRMKKFDLEFHPDIKCFFKDVDLIIGNLEGVISYKSCPITKQAHSGKILAQLESLLSGDTKWLLCLSNNHGEDFGNLLFNHSIQKIQRRSKFNVFGREDVSFIHNENNDINIYCATEWSNQKRWDYTPKYENLKNVSNLLDTNKFNILFPHNGYENEKYVRGRLYLDAKTLLTVKDLTDDYSRLQGYIRTKFNRIVFSQQKWDLIFAHHPHVLQPIQKIPDFILDDNGEDLKYYKLAVFSAGNFTSGANIIRKKKHISGIIMKCEIGPLEGHTEKLVVGKMEWRRTKNYKIRVNNILTKRVCVDNEKYRTYNHTLLITGIIYVILFLVLNFINSFI